jgi:ribosomal RNA assembly protein
MVKGLLKPVSVIMTMQYIRIPEERVRALIGQEGATKNLLEERTNCRIAVSDGEVSLEGEAVDEWAAKDIVHAIGRGFSPEKALTLLEDGYTFDYLELEEYGKTEKSRERIRGRVIGENGRTRKFIERTSGALMSVYGKTVAFIGPYEAVAGAKEACAMLCTGSRHSGVYRFLEKKNSRKP